MRKTISVVLPTFNEVEALGPFMANISKELDGLPYDYEFLIIDNASDDGTIELIRDLCAGDSRIKAIINTKNYGQIRSPFYGVLQAHGDAIIHLPSDGEVPATIIPGLLESWEQGKTVVHAVKVYSRKTLLTGLKHVFQRLLSRISSVELTYNSSGYGLVDKSVIAELRKVKSIFPYYRGLLNELSGRIGYVNYTHQTRLGGISKNTLLSLADYSLVGLVNHSKVPLRVVMLIGIASATVSMLTSIVYLVLKLMYWDSFQAGIAPIISLSLFVQGISMFFIGLIGEYLYHVFLNTREVPLVVEAERINFEE